MEGEIKIDHGEMMFLRFSTPIVIKALTYCIKAVNNYPASTYISRECALDASAVFSKEAEIVQNHEKP